MTAKRLNPRCARKVWFHPREYRSQSQSRKRLGAIIRAVGWAEEGGSQHDGRANRIDASVLYLSQEPATPVPKYQQRSPSTPRGAQVSYRVSNSAVCGFTEDYKSQS